jgi:signal peptidase II
MVRRGRRLVFAVLLIGGTMALDQIAKQVARAVLPPGEPIVLFPGAVLRLTRNVGAFLSFGSSLSGAARFWVLTVGVSLCLIGLLAWLLISHAPPAGAVAGMSLILGGGFSNLLDRLAHSGEVTDFLVLGVGAIRTGVFNLADVAITAGTVLLLVSLRSQPTRRVRARTREDSTA